MIRHLALAAALLLPFPAAANTLVDNINGISVERDGSVRLFVSLVFYDAGRFVQLIVGRGDAPRND
jgi:hypothetical protein